MTEPQSMLKLAKKMRQRAIMFDSGYARDLMNDGAKAIETLICAAAQPATRSIVIEECAQFLKASYPDHAWLNAACAAIRSLLTIPCPLHAPKGTQSDTDK